MSMFTFLGEGGGYRGRGYRGRGQQVDASETWGLEMSVVIGIDVIFLNLRAIVTVGVVRYAGSDNGIVQRIVRIGGVFGRRATDRNVQRDMAARRRIRAADIFEMERGVFRCHDIIGRLERSGFRDIA